MPILTPPDTPALTSSESARQVQQRNRDLYWEGDWLDLLERDAMAVLGTRRREAMGVLDQSCNLGPQICRELSTCYLTPPTVTRAGASPQLTAPDGPVGRALLWSLMPDFQGRVLWLQECILRIDITSTGDLLYRVVPPWLVECTADPARPDQPIVYSEWVVRTVDGEDRWTRDSIDLRDPASPVMLTTTDDGGGVALDITEEVWGRPMSGADYPFRWRDGTPFLPVELYHRDPACRLWSYTRGSELFSATRMAAVLWSFYVHLLRCCTWKQKAVLNARAVGGTAAGAAGNSYLSLDPTTILQLEAKEGSTAPPQLASWDEEDPRVVLTAIEGYLAQAAHAEGVSPAELQRISGDATSGYALSLTNAGKRAAQRRFGPQFKIRDESLLCKSAAIVNRVTGSSYPEDDYRVAYTSIPLSPEEERAIREQADWELAHGFISDAQALCRLRPELTEREAQAIIDRNQATAPPTPTPPPAPVAA